MGKNGHCRSRTLYLLVRRRCSDAVGLLLAACRRWKGRQEMGTNDG